MEVAHKAKAKKNYKSKVQPPPHNKNLLKKNYNSRSPKSLEN